MKASNKNNVHVTADTALLFTLAVITLTQGGYIVSAKMKSHMLDPFYAFKVYANAVLLILAAQRFALSTETSQRRQGTCAMVFKKKRRAVASNKKNLNPSDLYQHLKCKIECEIRDFPGANFSLTVRNAAEHYLPLSRCF